MINVNIRLLLQVFKWIQEHSHHQCKVCDFYILKIDNLKKNVDTVNVRSVKFVFSKLTT